MVNNQREDIRSERQPGKLRIVIIGGREFVVDSRLNELKSIDNPQERYSLADEDGLGRGQGGSELILTEQFAKTTGASKAEPKPERDRTRGR